MFVNLTGTRLTQGTLQYRVQRAYRRAGIEAERTAGALTHALRHTFATTMASNPTITVHKLAKMLGHESIATTQRYTEAAGAITRHAAATNPHYKLLVKAPSRNLLCPKRGKGWSVSARSVRRASPSASHRAEARREV